MSKIIEECEDRALAHIVQHANGKFYYIDSCYTFDHGLETMVFECEKDDYDNWNIDFTDLYMKLYRKYESMEKHHYWLVKNLERVINE